MYDITIINQNGQLLVDSREVAEMIGARHADLLEKIDGYVKHLTNGKFRSLDYFNASTYKDGKGEIRPCYLLTRKGCDMVANKLTGEKGVWFTAAYVARFEEMERSINGPYAGLSKELQAIFAIDQRTQVIETRLGHLEDNMTIDYGQQLTLQKVAKQQVIETLGGADSAAYTDKTLRSRVFSALWNDFKEYFNVDSYKNAPTKDYEKARTYIKEWRPPGKLLRDIDETNVQMAFQ
ncbi:antirepressor [Brevibacillus reuszeri]|uniref:ORF6C domain-containing protein n=1 Tax=Brevibacillus reuszeri TaxID=54915 RepID=UPI001B0A3FF0|nr:ORF6C domain-containing protein [Brevibacillus reuszeri]GIO09704.1 antirepressor [Brevibacillus reuszeri]